MIRLENVLSTSLKDVLKMSWRHLEDVLKMSWRCFCKASWKRLEDFLARHLEDVFKTSSEDVWLGRIYSSWSRRLETNMKDVLETSSSRRIFAGVNCECSWKKNQVEKKVVSVMMVSNIFRPLYVTLAFAHNNHFYHHYCYYH